MEDQKSMIRKCIIFSLAISCLAAGCSKREAPPVKTAAKEAVEDAQPEAKPPEDAVKQKVLSFNLEGFSEKGDKKWEIQGESAEAVQEDKVKLDNIVAKTFGEEAEATLSADKGLYDKTRNNVTLEKNVKVTIENTPKLAGEYVDFSLTNMADKGGEDAKEESLDLDKKGTTVITCDGEVEFNYEENRAYFTKNVKVTSEGGEIDAEKITVFLDIKTKKINEVVAEGSVKIIRGENISYSDKATYIAGEKRVILSGRPKLVFYSEGDMEAKFLGE